MDKKGQLGKPPQSVKSPKPGKTPILEKYKLPIIITLSILIVTIFSLILVVILTGNNNPQGQNQGSEDTKEFVKTQSEYVDEYKKDIKSLYEEVKNSDNPEETRAENVQKLTDLANDKYTATSEKVYAVDTIAKMYIHAEPRDYASAVTLIEETLTDPDLNSYQKTNLLGRLEEIYRKLDNKELLIDTIHRIMAIPADDSYTKDFKTLNDNNLSSILKELEQ